MDSKNEINLYGQLIEPLEPFDLNYLPPLLKSYRFLELLSKADESFDYITEAFNAPCDFVEDENGLVSASEADKSRYEFKMKPIHDCESFISQHPFNFWDLIFLINHAKQMGVSAQAQVNAYKRLENDPKQKALDEIYDEYQSRKSQFKRRGYSAQFIREMHDKYPVITSIKTIEKLVSELNKENE